MRIQIVDPGAYSPPYDHSLCSALAKRGVDVALVTGPNTYGLTHDPDGYEVQQFFYRHLARISPKRGLRRKALQILEHGPGMIRYRSRARNADVVHYQWFAIEELDAFLVPSKRPRVFTAHDVLPREARRGQPWAARRLLREMDAVVVHSRHGAQRLEREAGVDPARIHVIPHGAFDYLTRLPREDPLPGGFATARGTVILYFGTIRPYKGVDVLVEAFRMVEDAELWIVGVPRIPLDFLTNAVRQAQGRIRVHPHFIPDEAIPAFFRRADVVVLPYRQIDQSGVLYTALPFGKPIVATSVGGFPEVIRDHEFGVLADAGDPASLADALNTLVANRETRIRLGEAATRVAKEEYSWSAIAERTLAMYRELVAG